MSQEAALLNLSQSPFAQARNIPLSAVQFREGFWKERQEVVAEKGLPHGWDQLQESGAIEAFDIAAGKCEKPDRGYVFRDSHVYKWIEASAYALNLGYHQFQEHLFHLTKKIKNAQDADGYLNTYFYGDRKHLRFTDLLWNHEIYCAGHFIQSALAHKKVTHTDELFGSAVRLAECLYHHFGPQGRRGACGHPCAEMALVELYRETRNKTWLELAERFLNVRGTDPPLFQKKPYFLDHLPFRMQREAVGHAVRALYLYAGATDIFLETGDSSIWEVLNAVWIDLNERKTYITGGVGSRHEGEAIGDAWELPNARAYAESCAGVASVMWNWRMFAADPQPKFIDALERALYNNVLSGISINAQRYFYTNPLESDGSHERKKWFSCACCPPNLYRTILSVHNLFFAQNQNTLYINLYDNVSLRTNLFALDIFMNYPFEGEGTIVVHSEGTKTIKLRIPNWSQRTTIITPEGEKIYPEAGTYASLTRDWRPGDRLEISLDMSPKILYAHPRMRENHGRVAIIRGPLVFCLEAEDNPSVSVLDAQIHPEITEVKGSAISGVPYQLQVRGCAPPSIQASSTGAIPTPWNSYLRTLPAYRLGAQEKIPLQDVTLVAIPYFAWANRKPNEMITWVPLTCR